MFVGKIDGTFFFDRPEDVITWSKQDGFHKYDIVAFDFNIFNDEMYMSYTDIIMSDTMWHVGKIDPSTQSFEDVTDGFVYVTDIQTFSDGLLIAGLSFGNIQGPEETPLVAYIDEQGEQHELYDETVEPFWIKDSHFSPTVDGGMEISFGDVTLQINPDWSIVL